MTSVANCAERAKGARASLNADEYQIVKACVATPVVCVGLATYNQEAFVSQAIDGVLFQKTNFSVRLMISDDGSTDRTAEICRSYQQKYPDRIELLLAHRNTNFCITHLLFERCGMSGAKYVTSFDGDDFWTDSLKLQKQVDFLRGHPACAMVFTRAIEDRAGQQEMFAPQQIMDVYPQYSILGENFIRTCTVMYRNLFRGVCPQWAWEMPVGDWALHVLHSLHGDIGYIDEPTAVYRIHQGGVWASRSPIVNSYATIEAYKVMAKHLPAEVPRQPLKDGIIKVHRELVYYCMVWGNAPWRGWRSLMALLSRGRWPFGAIGDFARAIVWTACPPLGRRLRSTLQARRGDRRKHVAATGGASVVENDCE